MNIAVQILKPIIADAAMRLKAHWASILGTAGTWGGAIMTWQDQVAWWTKEMAGLAAMVVSVLTAIHILKNWNKK